MRKKTDNLEHPQLNTPTTPGGSGANRRRFLQGAAGLGLSATALSGMFSDYVGSFSSVWAADYDPMKSGLRPHEICGDENKYACGR